MPNTLTEISVPELLSSELERVPGVQRAFVDAQVNRIYLVCDAADQAAALDAAVASVLDSAGITAEAVDVHFSFPAAPVVDRRVRFVDLQLERPTVGIARAITTLEWAGQRFDGSAEGEAGAVGEIRTCAQSAVRSLDSLLHGRVPLELLGIKSIRIFDQDLISVILRSPEAPDRRLVGVSLVLQDMHRSSVLAVLNATNRLLGNYLG